MHSRRVYHPASCVPSSRSGIMGIKDRIVAFERRDAAFGLGIIGRLDWGLDHAYGIILVAAFIQASKMFHQTRQQDQSWEARRDEICAEVSARVTHGQSLLSTPQAPKARQPPPQRSGPRAIAEDSPTPLIMSLDHQN